MSWPLPALRLPLAAACALVLLANATAARAAPADSARAAAADSTGPAGPASVPTIQPVPTPAMAVPDSAPAPVETLPDSVAPAATDFEGFFDRFIRQRADSNRVARVTNLTFRRDVGTFTLTEGELRPATPVDGRVCALVFTGRGSFTMTPRTRIEREQLARFYGTTTITRAFTTLVMVFSDSTLEELGRGLTFAPARGPGASAVLRECLRYVSDERSKWIDAAVARPFLEGVRDGYSLAMIDGGGEKLERLFFEVDPHRSEAVTFYREPSIRHVGLKRVYRRDAVCRFARAGADTVPESDVRPALAIRRYRIESRIPEDLAFSASAELECRAMDPRVSWARFTLFERLEVDTAFWADGTPARFFKGKDSPQLWVSRARPLAGGETATLTIRYHGRLIDRVGDWMFVESPTGWYPQAEGWERAPMDLTFHAPSQYLLASVGDRRGSETRAGVSTTRWGSDQPIRNATFVIGVFAERPITLPGRPPGAPSAVALVMKGIQDSVSFVSVGQRRWKMGGRMEQGVADDAGRALAFFHTHLGPPTARAIRVVEMPALGGEAFPGLVRITWTPFSGPNAAAEDAVFRAHEMAHQWWGVDVDFKTYRDQWLSEGFSEYCALWYMQAGRKDNRSYFAVLDQWQEELLAEPRQRPSGAPPLGPIWIGGRVATVEAPNDFNLAVYKKGAWVLHMLRNLMLDLKTMDDERFAAMLRDFYGRYAGRTAATEDFRKIAQRYAGEDLGWFFDQWVYGGDMPTYRFAYRTERTADGKYKVTCRVEQRGVPETFRMPVPVRIDFTDGRFTWVRLMVQSPRAEFELPIMDIAPKQVVFNDLHSVLCRVETVKW